MKKVYVANDPMHAHLLKEILESNGIEALIRDEQTFYLRGELPLVYPSVWTSDESAEAARKLCVEFDTSKKHSGRLGSWVCPTCGETIGAEFTDCWKCAKVDGVEMPLADAPKAKSSGRKWFFKFVFVIVGVCSTMAYLRWCHDQASANLRDAIQLLRSEKPEKAILTLDEAAGWDSRWALLYYNRAVAHSRLHHVDKAIADYTRALELKYAKPAEALVNRAQLLSEDRSVDAIADCNQAIFLDPTARAYGIRAHLMLKDGQLEAARHDIQQALKIDPGYVYAMYLQGYVFVNTGALEDTLAIAEKIQRRQPRSKLAHELKAEVFRLRDQSNEAIEAYSHEISSDERNANAYCHRGFYYLDSGDYKTAIADFSKAIELDPRILNAFRGRAHAYRLLGDTEKSQQDIELIAAAKPNSRDRYLERAWAWAEKGGMVRANDDMRYANEKLGWSWQSDYQSAIVYCARARHLAPDSAGDDSRKSNLDKAIECLEAAKKKGFKFWGTIARDPDLNMLQNDPRIQAMNDAKF